MRIGFITMPLTGHANPMAALARAMLSRGHEVIFFGVPDVGPYARAAELPFIPVAEEQFPAGSTNLIIEPIRTLHGIDVLKYSVTHFMAPATAAVLEELPAKFEEAGIEAVVIDTVHFFVELAAIQVGLPYAHVWNILPVDTSTVTPICHYSWPLEDTPEARSRNLEGVKEAGGIFEPMLVAARAYAEQHQLSVDLSVVGMSMSNLAVVAQTPREFDFPGVPWPPHFHYTGPFTDSKGREPIKFPWEQLGDEPLIYASMGTLVNGNLHVYRSILAVARMLPQTQFVLSIGENTDLNVLGEIPANAIVVSRAPQLELLQRAALCITHAGLNTALECLTEGVPMVAIPVGFDQPGVAARIRYHKVGDFIEADEVTEERLFDLTRAMLEDPTYRQNAQRLQTILRESKGLDQAADVIESALTKALAGYLPLNTVSA